MHDPTNVNRDCGFFLYECGGARTFFASKISASEFGENFSCDFKLLPKKKNENKLKDRQKDGWIDQN